MQLTSDRNYVVAQLPNGESIEWPKGSASMAHYDANERLIVDIYFAPREGRSGADLLDFTSALDKFLNDPESFQECGRAGFRWVSEKVLLRERGTQ